MMKKFNYKGFLILISPLVLFLFLAFIPSLLHSGRRVYFSSNYYPLALKVDESDIFTTPSDVYLKKGDHTATLHYGDIILKTVTFKVKPYLFFSYITEGVMRVDLNITESDVQKYYERALKDMLLTSSLYSTVFYEEKEFQIPNYKEFFKTQVGSVNRDKTQRALKAASRMNALNLNFTDGIIRDKNGNEGKIDGAVFEPQYYMDGQHEDLSIYSEYNIALPYEKYYKNGVVGVFRD